MLKTKICSTIIGKPLMSLVNTLIQHKHCCTYFMTLKNWNSSNPHQMKMFQSLSFSTNYGHNSDFFLLIHKTQVEPWLQNLCFTIWFSRNLRTWKIFPLCNSNHCSVKKQELGKLMKQKPTMRLMKKTSTMKTNRTMITTMMNSIDQNHIYVKWLHHYSHSFLLNNSF